MNKELSLLTFSDVFILSGFGLVSPILAIFIKDHLVGGTIASAGIASMIFFLTKSLVQIPFAKYIDTHANKKFWAIAGTVLIAITPFIYLGATSIYHIYIAQFIYGIGAGIAAAGWLGLWTLYLDKHHESFEWSLYSVFVGLGTGLAALVGAAMAQYLGFRITFVVVGILSVIGCILLFYIKERLAEDIATLDAVGPEGMARGYHRRRKAHHLHH